MASVGAAAQSSAAISLCVSLMEILTSKGIITKADALDIFDTLASAKQSKAAIHASPEELEASQLLAHLRQRFSDRV